MIIIIGVVIILMTPATEIGIDGVSMLLRSDLGLTALLQTGTIIHGLVGSTCTEMFPNASRIPYHPGKRGNDTFRYCLRLQCYI